MKQIADMAFSRNPLDLLLWPHRPSSVWSSEASFVGHKTPAHLKGQRPPADVLEDLSVSDVTHFTGRDCRGVGNEIEEPTSLEIEVLSK